MKPIPFRERLSVRLAAGMIAVALLSLLVAFIIQLISFALSDLQPPDIENKLKQMIAENPDDVGLKNLIETPLRIRNLVARSALISLFVSAVLWIFFAIRFARSIAMPIENVTLAAAQMTRGDLTTRVHIPINTKGEPARLLDHFNEMATSLERYEQERTEMIAAIAHELRTPLAVIRTRLEVMEEGLVEINPLELTKLSRQVDLLIRLVNDLRTLSLADANRLSLKRQPLRFHDLIQTVTESLQSRAQEHQIKLETTLNPVELGADPDRLTQVIFNLLDNALKYTPDHGHIYMSLSSENQIAEFTITNTGTGFAVPAEQLFQRFYTTSEYSGSGIGLALVKTITELHGGKVSAQNIQGLGAQFSLYLPIQ